MRLIGNVACEKGKPWETMGRKAKGLYQQSLLDGSRIPQTTM